MDKNSIVNDLYHTTLISTFYYWFTRCKVKIILKMVPFSIQKFDLERTEKTSCFFL